MFDFNQKYTHIKDGGVFVIHIAKAPKAKDQKSIWLTRKDKIRPMTSVNGREFMSFYREID